MRIILKIGIPLLIFTVLALLPALINPGLILDRDNDLSEFFWPLFYYLKQSIFNFQQIPLWNNLFFMGTPLLPDPQNPIWYPPNLIFLFLPIDAAFLLSFFSHMVFAGLGVYLAGRELKFSSTASLIIAGLYIAAPKLAGYLEAGHYGLIISSAWTPWAIYFIKKQISNPKTANSLLLALSLAAIYVNHLPTVLICFPAAAIFWLITFLEKPNRDTLFYSILSAILLSVIVLPIFLIQAKWYPQTTRDLLLAHPDVYPKWDTEWEFLQNIFILKTKNTEKIILLGIVPAILAFIGFMRSKLRHKIIFLALGTGISLIALNNLSPLADLLIRQKWFVMLRVATRAWFILIILTIFLAGYTLSQIKNKKLLLIIGFIGIIESLITFHKITTFKRPPNFNRVPLQVYEDLTKDKENFRVFCTTKCFSQKQAAIYNLKLAEGYGTLQQKNYYLAAKQIGQYSWDSYTLAIPPFEIYNSQKLQPQGKTLATYGIKYVVSPHPLMDKDLVFVGKYGGFAVYRNLRWQATNYLIYTPNLIRLRIDRPGKIVIPEIFSQNWHAYEQGGQEIQIAESPDHLRQVDVRSGVKFVDFKYQVF